MGRRYIPGQPPMEPSPGQLLRHFTDREPQRDILLRLLGTPEGQGLPLIAFYGVGGIGKSFLGQRLLAELTGNPPAGMSPWFTSTDQRAVVRLDLERRESLLYDPILALHELRSQLTCECLRFDLALAWLRHKQGVSNEPSLLRTRADRLAAETVQEVVDLVLDDIPGASLGQYVLRKLGEKLQGTKLGEKLTSRALDPDFVRLKNLTQEDFTFRFFAQRLADDLYEELPTRAGQSCRLVVILDTFERIAIRFRGDIDQYRQEEWVRSLWEYLSTFTLIVVLGQNRLDWERHDPDWNRPELLEQHLLGGLSATDATDYLKRCGVADLLVQTAFLSVSRDPETPTVEAYHPASLGLCADIAFAETAAGRTIDPTTFDFEAGQITSLAERFLKALTDEDRGVVELLALPPRFDEHAVRSSTPLHAAWERLLEYSFVLSLADGWYGLHGKMRWVLLQRWNQKPAVLAKAHQVWADHWAERQVTETDGFAALRWFHQWSQNEEKAREDWKAQAQKARDSGNMATHFSLLDWWEPTRIEIEPATTREHALALVTLAVECYEATLGRRQHNTDRAIACYREALYFVSYDSDQSLWATIQNNLGNLYSERPESLSDAVSHYNAALEAYTKEAYPDKWAAIQNNLGNLYLNLPVGEHADNQTKSIHCFLAALEVYSQTAFKERWAAIQNNLGNVYAEYQVGDHTTNQATAIAYYTAALEVYGRDTHPREWARTLDNLGNVYAESAGGADDANLTRAVTCYTEALLVRTRDTYPEDWAQTQFNLGLALHKRGDQVNACAALRQAQDGYRVVGDTAAVEQIEQHCQAMGCPG